MLSYRQTLVNAAEIGALFMPMLWRGDELLAVMGGIEDSRLKRLHFVVSGRNVEAVNPAIGLLLHAGAIAVAVERHSCL